MAKSKKDMRDAGREGREREEATRSSRRAKGLPPEEHASLEEVVRTARKAGAAKRKAAREEKKRSLSQDQPAAEPPVQDDAHLVSADVNASWRPVWVNPKWRLWDRGVPGGGSSFGFPSA
ncbi:hypothetical protein PF008_g19386 [Phytophthora fragariae]|uniref:Uncharacterized protein n=1 Tax=Phytophthora fragariae TaxID=53985 RepID=A0A6G0R2T4_9STRA|nr:hypothetical protein PF008_g19386 [Phytophthora fragariae]